MVTSLCHTVSTPVTMQCLSGRYRSTNLRHAGAHQSYGLALTHHCRWRADPYCCCASSGDGELEDRMAEGDSSIPDALPVSGVDTDWREFRAKLVSASSKSAAAREAAARSDTSGASTAKQREFQEGYWAHKIGKPEKGCLLVAHPLMFAAEQAYFCQAVIFLFEHHDVNGSAGLILNRPTQYTIGSIAGADMLCPEFANNSLFLGGDVGADSVLMLHSRPDLESAVEVVNGVYMGGIEAAKAAVRDAKTDPNSFRWFTRYAGWAPGQLAKECEAGVWFVAAAGKSVILEQQTTGKQHWHEVLELMGGEYAELSRTMWETYRADVMEIHPEDIPKPETDVQS